ncbi:MAG: GerMN domain-containing protein [Spirochaetaceae bacterium]|nr:GerMN domain-containing protein [Spirochaetaceae bacterium]
MAKKKAKSSLGVTFWVALLVFLGLLYAANRINLPDIMGGSGASEVVQIFGGDYRNTADDEASGPPQEEPPAVSVSPPPSAPPASGNAGSPGNSGSKPPLLPARPAPETPRSPDRQNLEPKPPAAEKPVETASRPPAPPPESAAKPAEAAGKARESVLYFIHLSEAGTIALAKTSREIRSDNAPLTDTLRELAAGPTEKESRSGCTSLIPAGSRLLSVTVRDGVAFINFDENFRFNAFGREGYDGQIRQIVYTATEFPAIHSVQILINGGRIDYLGSEGIYIGKPVGRKDI